VFLAFEVDGNENLSFGEDKGAVVEEVL